MTPPSDAQQPAACDQHRYDLNGREVLVGVTGGIAAYKTADLVSKLVQAGAGVSVAMTVNAERFVGRTTFEALTRRPVYVGQYNPVEHFQGEHIGLAERADVYVIAPAGANVLAKLAHGMADDLVSTLALTVVCPVLVAPAMNREMWDKPAVQRNVRHLIEDGLHTVGPGEGWQSCRAVGSGRMSEPAEIIDALARLLAVSG